MFNEAGLKNCLIIMISDIYNSLNVLHNDPGALYIHLSVMKQVSWYS